MADSEDMLPTSYPQDGGVADETAVSEVFWAVGRLFGFSSGRTARIVTGTSAGFSGSASGVTARIVTGLDAESAL